MKHLRVFLKSVRQSSEIFGNSRKMFGIIRLAFQAILKNFRKSSESGRKFSENHQKRRHQYICIIKHYTLARRYEFYVLVARTISYSFARSLVKYCACHSNIKFISSRHRRATSFQGPFSWLGGGAGKEEKRNRGGEGTRRIKSFFPYKDGFNRSQKSKIVYEKKKKKKKKKR